MAYLYIGIIVLCGGVCSGLFGLSHNVSPSQQMIASMENGWSDPYTIFLIGSLVLMAAGLILMLIGKQEMNRLQGKVTLWKKLRRNRMFLIMMLPGTLFMLVYSYITMPGVLVAFKDLQFKKSSFMLNFFNSSWYGFKNFQFFFSSSDFILVTVNSVLYHLLFMIVGMVGGIAIAAIGNEIYNHKATRFYQTVFIFPSFISWVIVSYLIFSILSPEFGTANGFLKAFSLSPVNWYSETKWWPFFLTFINFWKSAGLGSIYYFAIITGIDPELYQAAMIDGASKWRQFTAITLPGLKMMIAISTILGLSGIMTGGDIGLFWISTLQMGRGALFNVCMTVSTYVFNALIFTRNWVQATAVGLYSSIVGLVMVVVTNLIVRKIDPDSSLF